MLLTLGLDLTVRLAGSNLGRVLSQTHNGLDRTSQPEAVAVVVVAVAAVVVAVAAAAAVAVVVAVAAAAAAVVGIIAAGVVVSIVVVVLVQRRHSNGKCVVQVRTLQRPVDTRLGSTLTSLVSCADGAVNKYQCQCINEACRVCRPTVFA